jgi:hypothetical protein
MMLSSWCSHAASGVASRSGNCFSKKAAQETSQMLLKNKK